ncbi:MAG: hypothetical protein JST00_08220 [Deltaproteobacteria bacterium]|nr:hypothetical protein [Deltaproteobacteria bacterium]
MPSARVSLSNAPFSASIRRALLASPIAVILLASAPARADVPSSEDDNCTVAEQCSGQGVECDYVRSEPDGGDATCRANATARGLVRLCSRGGGTVGKDIYCPSGTERKSSGCQVAAPLDGPVSGTATLIPLALSACFAFAWLRRRPRR